MTTFVTTSNVLWISVFLKPSGVSDTQYYFEFLTSLSSATVLFSPLSSRRTATLRFVKWSRQFLMKVVGHPSTFSLRNLWLWICRHNKLTFEPCFFVECAGKQSTFVFSFCPARDSRIQWLYFTCDACKKNATRTLSGTGPPFLHAQNSCQSDKKFYDLGDNQCTARAGSTKRKKQESVHSFFLICIVKPKFLI